MTHTTPDSATSPSPIRQNEIEEEMISSITEPVQDQAATQVASTGLPDELEKELVQVFKLLSDESRLRILL